MQRFIERPAGAVEQVWCLWKRFVSEESGQDLLEYAFGAAFVGIVGYLALNGIVSALGITYGSWLDPTTGAPSLWEPAAPSGS